MFTALTKGLTGTRFKGSAFLWVTTYGRIDPITVEHDWNLIDLFDHYYHLQIQNLMENA